MGDSKFLSDRVVDMNEQGTEKTSLYYDTASITLEAVQFDVLCGKYNQSTSSKTFGSTSSITIANSDSVSSVYLYVKLPMLDANASLPESWLISAVRSISYTWGSSSISVVLLSGTSVMQALLLQTETVEKAKRMLTLAGSASIKGKANLKTHDAVIQIPLPWSTIRAEQAKRPYDASILNSPIEIQITFHDAPHFIGSHGTVVYPNEFLRSEVFLKQSVLSNKANSMARTLRENPNLLLSYPFTYLQDGTTRAIASHPKDTEINHTLQSFIEADMIGISFYIVPTDNEKSAGQPALSASRKFDMLRCRDISLVYNGQILHSFVGYSNELYSLGLDVGDCHAGKTLIDNAGIEYVTTASNQRYFVYYLPFTHLKSIVFNGTFPNTSRFSQQQMSLIFTPELLADGGVIVPATQNITIRTMYMMNAMNTTSRGVTSLQFA